LGLCFILITAEVGQLFLPHRHFDIWDILVGSIAIVLGIFIGENILKITKNKKTTSKTT
jgi:VanZ family protein